MRLSASEVATALAHIGYPAVRPATLRHWRYKGWLSTGRGYDEHEVMAVYRARAERHLSAPPMCKLNGCDSSVASRGLCARHYRRLMLYGDPAYEPSLGKGDDIGYAAVHARLRREFGRASSYRCVECGRKGDVWAYDHEGFDALIDQQGLEFSTKADHYRPMCNSCHVAFDNAHRAQGCV